MIAVASLAVGIFVALIAATVLGVPAPKLRFRRRRSRQTLQDRLDQAGAAISARRYRVVVVGVAATVAGFMWWATGTIATTSPPFVAVLLAPRYWFARTRRHQLAERSKAWPEALRDVVEHLGANLTLNQALAELGDTGPEALRDTWRRFAANTHSLDIETALDVARSELADPISDRVIEMLRGLHRMGGGPVAMTILHDLIETTAEDASHAASLYTAQYELRVQAIVAGILPFVLLAMLCSGNSGFRAFYSSPAGLVVVVVGAAMSLGGWTLVDRLGRLPIEPRVVDEPEIVTEVGLTFVGSRAQAALS